MVVHYVSAVVLELRIVTVRCQCLINEYKASVRAGGDTALTARLASGVSGGPVTDVHHI